MTLEQVPSNDILQSTLGNLRSNRGVSFINNPYLTKSIRFVIVRVYPYAHTGGEISVLQYYSSYF